MERDISQYLHLYLGQFACDELNNKIFLLDQESICEYFDNDEGEYLNDIKPILRPLSDMTEKEAKECWKPFKSASYRFTGFDGPSRSIFYKNGNNNPGSEVLNKPEQFRYLLSCGFDLFNLIPDGLAIDATTINKAV